MLPKRILVPTDFTAQSRDALATAIMLAGVYEAGIRIVHVQAQGPLGTVDCEAPSQGCREWCEAFAHPARAARVPTEVEVVAGLPIEQITQAGRGQDVEMILLGEGETAAGEEFQLGRTALGVARDADKPVWVVKHGGAVRARTILCPFDGSPASQHALLNAVHLARGLRADLDILRVLDQEYVRRNEAGLEEQLTQYDLDGVRWQKTLRQGSPCLEILSYARQTRTDLIVMGSFGHNALRRWLLGSQTENVLRGLPCSALVVKGCAAARPVEESATGEIRQPHSRQHHA
jgi:universal stress protein E